MARKSLRWALAFAVATLGCQSLVSATDLTAIRSSDANDKSRFVIDLSDTPTSWSSTYNEANHTVTVRVADTTNAVTEPVKSSGTQATVVKGVGLQQVGKDLTINLEANKAVQYNAFALTNPHRIVVDIFSPYTQKTTKEWDDQLSNVKWKTTVKEGPIMASVFKVQPDVAFKMYSSDTGDTVKNLSSSNRAAVGLAEAGKPLTSSVQTTSGVTITSLKQLEASSQLVYNPDRGYFINQKLPNLQAKSKHWSLPITLINGPRTANSLILYTRDYGTSTKTNAYGTEVTIVNNKVTALSHDGNSPIDLGEFVLSAHGEAADTLNSLRVGDSVLLQTTPDMMKVTQENSQSYNLGRPVLVNGRYVGTKRSANAARSFLGTTSAKELFVVTVDKNASDSVGVTMKEGAVLLKECGIVDALELTGQGSVDTAYKGKAVHGNGTKIYTKALVFVD